MARRKKLSRNVSRRTKRNIYNTSIQTTWTPKSRAPIKIQPITYDIQRSRPKTSIIKRQRKTLHKRISAAVNTIQNPFKALIIKPIKRRMKKCEKVEKADEARRRNFFKAKGKGGGARPAHNRKHIRRC